MSKDEMIRLLERPGEMSADDLIRIITEMKLTIKPGKQDYWIVTDKFWWMRERTIGGCLQVILRALQHSKAVQERKARGEQVAA